MISEDILLCYISGKSTKEEDAIVDSWLSESEENKKQLEQFYFIWRTADCIRAMDSVDPQGSLSVLKKRIKQKRRKQKMNNTLFRIQRIAAILFVPALMLAYYFYKQSPEDVLQYMEVRTNPGMITSVILPDSSKVWINSCSYLKYPVRFTNGNRTVSLEGEAFFDVKKNTDSPFQVNINDNYSVSVLGTKFNVSAYPDDDRIETTLVEGLVQLNATTSFGKQIEQILRPNQKGVFYKDELSLQQVDPLYETSWKDGKMYFKNHPMNEVLKRLSRHYNVVFEVKNPEVLESYITAKFDSEQLLQVLEYLKLASGLKYKIQKPNITDDKLNEMPIELTK
jgi:ferric-dicitrate binding protein FerR (iron transport regulator)